MRFSTSHKYPKIRKGRLLRKWAMRELAKIRVVDGPIPLLYGTVRPEEEREARRDERGLYLAGVLDNGVRVLEGGD